MKGRGDFDDYCGLKGYSQVDISDCYYYYHWFNHGGQAQMTTWLNDGTKWVLKQIEDHKVLLGSVLGTVGLVVMGVLILLDD